jgi:hypothetical protein
MTRLNAQLLKVTLSEKRKLPAPSDRRLPG